MLTTLLSEMVPTPAAALVPELHPEMAELGPKIEAPIVVEHPVQIYGDILVHPKLCLSHA